MSNVIVKTEHGSFCAACQSLLSIEEEDFGVCDACDGEGIGGDDEETECETLPVQKSGLDRAEHGGCGTDPIQRLAVVPTPFTSTPTV